MRRLILIIAGAYLLAMLIMVIIPTSIERAGLMAAVSIGALIYLVGWKMRHE